MARAGEMWDGLGMAETTPGPLIQVVQFAMGIGVIAFVVLFGLRWGILRTLGISVLLGVAWSVMVAG